MKKIFIAIGMLTTITALTSCDDSENEISKLYKEHYAAYERSIKVDSTGMKATKFKYDEHNYIMFMGQTKGSECIVHDPECSKCLDIFD